MTDRSHERPERVIAIPDDGGVAAIVAVIARPSVQVIDAPDRLRRRVLSDQDLAARRAELAALKTLAKHPESLRPKIQKLAQHKQEAA